MEEFVIVRIRLFDVLLGVLWGLYIPEPQKFLAIEHSSDVTEIHTTALQTAKNTEITLTYGLCHQDRQRLELEHRGV